MLGLRHDRILMYHGTPRRDATALERQLRLVKLAFAVVSVEELRQGSNGRARIALTFDDGLRSNAEVAYPILQKLGLTATFFVCPGLIERGQWLWNHEARQRLLSLGKRAAEGEATIERMKTMKVAERRRVEEEIRASTPDFEPSRQEREEFDLASWDELRSLDPRTVTIGSPTMTHPLLTPLA